MFHEASSRNHEAEAEIRVRSKTVQVFRAGMLLAKSDNLTVLLMKEEGQVKLVGLISG